MISFNMKQETFLVFEFLKINKKNINIQNYIYRPDGVAKRKRKNDNLYSFRAQNSSKKQSKKCLVFVNNNKFIKNIHYDFI